MELSYVHSQVYQRSFGLELTDRCNFNCIHCYQDRGNTQFDPTLLDKVVALAQANNMLQVYLTGGEPFLYKNFVNIYTRLKELGFFVSVFSNGSIIPKDIKKIFLKNPPNMMEISIYGFSEKSYTKSTTVGNSFGGVVESIQFLTSQHINFLLKYTLMKSTVADLGKFINFTREHKINATYNAQIMPKISGTKSPLSQRLSPKILLEICHKYDLNLFNTEQAYCEAGKHLYIRSDEKIYGCPILRTGFEPNIFAHTRFYQHSQEKFWE